MCTEKDKRAEHQLPPALGSPPRVAATARRTVQCVSGPGEGRAFLYWTPCRAVSSAQQSEGLTGLGNGWAATPSGWGCFPDKYTGFKAFRQGARALSGSGQKSSGPT